MDRHDVEVRSAVRERYRHAYKIANSIDALGGLVTLTGGILGALIFLAGVWFTTREIIPGNFFAALLGGLPGVLVALAAYIAGTFIHAQGQMMLATLDIAVCDSPFLTDEDRLVAMDV